jgi:hypothetical protein
MVSPNAIDPGVIAGSQTLCSPFDPDAFTNTTSGSGDGAITYQWQMSTTIAVAGFSDIGGATSATYDAGVVAVVTWFRRVATSTLNSVPCADNSNVLEVITEPCGGPLCSYTQGYYGNPGGTSCDGETQYSTYGLIEKAIGSYGGTMRIGLLGQSVLITDSEADINNVIWYMPGGKGIGELVAQDISISSNDFKSWYTTTTGKNTKINNKLLAQTIALGFNIGINSNLGDFALQTGTFATAELDGGCGSSMIKSRYCDTETGTVYNEYQYYKIKSNIAGAASDVNALFALANRALGNADGLVGSEDGVSLTDIASAVDLINNAFDECRMPMGYGIEKLPCSIIEPIIPATTLVQTEVVEEPALSKSSTEFKAYPVPFTDELTIEYKYDYDTDVKIQVFDTKGLLITNDVDNLYIKGEIGTKILDLSRVSDQALIIRLVTNKEVNSKMVIAKSKKRK